MNSLLARGCLLARIWRPSWASVLVTLRVALKSLETSGYVTTSIGARGGSRVNDEAGLSRCWEVWLAEHVSDIEEMFELRTTLETRIASLAAERRTAADLEELEAANALLVGPSPSVAPWNVAFHGALARAAHSGYLARAMEDLQAKIFLPIDLAKYEHQIVELREAHAAVLEAVRAEKPDLAAESMRFHLAETLQVFRRAIVRLGRPRLFLPLSQSTSVHSKPDLPLHPSCNKQERVGKKL